MGPLQKFLLDGLTVSIIFAALTTYRAQGAAPFHFGNEIYPPELLITTPVPQRETNPELFNVIKRLIVKQHKVGVGDHLWNLAAQYGTTWESLRSTNRLESVLLSSGQLITVHNRKGMLHTVKRAGGRVETLDQLARKYNQPLRDIVFANELPAVAVLAWDLQEGDKIFIPNAKLRFSDYILPVGWGRISSFYGLRRHPILRVRRFHKGLDMPRPRGTPVKAAREGRVIFAGWKAGYGRLVIVRHPDGLTTHYGHLGSIAVQQGAWVKQGKLVGRVGSSGLSTGPHLHFEVHDKYGRSLNPKKYLY